MFSYRSDKVGFFAALVLGAIALATAVATLVLLLQGDWDSYGPWMKFVWGLAWVLSIVTVLFRVYAFRFRRVREQRKKQANGTPVVAPAPSSNGEETSAAQVDPVPRTES